MYIDLGDILLKIGAVILVLMVLAFVSMFGFLLYGAATGQLPTQIHYKECIADGQKEYVCYGLIYGRR